MPFLDLILILFFQIREPNARVFGRVIDQATEAPVSGARVVFAFRGRTWQTLTDQGGRYTFEDLEPGPYELAVDKVGYVKPPDPWPTIRLVAGQTLEVAAVRLQKTGVITGRLFDPQGEPLQDVSVRAIRRGLTTAAAAGSASRPNVADLLRQAGRTNDLGEFRLYGLAPGEYVVVASPQPFGLATGAVSTAMSPETFYPGTPDPLAAQVFTVASGQTISIDFLLTAAPAFKVAGIVIDEAGSAIPGATVMMAIDAGASGSDLDPSREVEHLVGGVYGGVAGRPVSTETDSSGRFEIANITSGAYYATAAAVSRAIGGDGIERPNQSRSDPVQILVNDADVEGVTIVVPRRQ